MTDKRAVLSAFSQKINRFFPGVRIFFFSFQDFGILPYEKQINRRNWNRALLVALSVQVALSKVDSCIEMMTFGDRTAEFAAVAQALRNKGLKPVTKRKDTLYTSRMQINQLASEIGKDTHATSQKLAVLTKCTHWRTVTHTETRRPALNGLYTASSPLCDSHSQ